MSRTDKDRPYWVKANDETLLRAPRHDHTSLGIFFSQYLIGVSQYSDHCTIDEPVERNWRDNENRIVPTCDYAPSVYHRLERSHTREDRKNDYYRPLRAKERDILKGATREYNTYGNFEKDIAFADNHQSSELSRGYW